MAAKSVRAYPPSTFTGIGAEQWLECLPSIDKLLTYLESAGLTMRTLDLSDCLPAANDMLPFYKTLKVSMNLPNLDVLRLTGAQLTKAAWEVTAHFVFESPSLRTLSATRTNIDKGIAELLIEAATYKFTQLQLLDMRGIHVSPQVAYDILMAEWTRGQWTEHIGLLVSSGELPAWHLEHGTPSFGRRVSACPHMVDVRTLIQDSDIPLVECPAVMAPPGTLLITDRRPDLPSRWQDIAQYEGDLERLNSSAAIFVLVSRCFAACEGTPGSTPLSHLTNLQRAQYDLSKRLIEIASAAIRTISPGDDPGNTGSVDVRLAISQSLAATNGRPDPAEATEAKNVSGHAEVVEAKVVETEVVEAKAVSDPVDEGWIIVPTKKTEKKAAATLEDAEARRNRRQVLEDVAAAKPETIHGISRRQPGESQAAFCRRRAKACAELLASAKRQLAELDAQEEAAAASAGKKKRKKKKNKKNKNKRGAGASTPAGEEEGEGGDGEPFQFPPPNPAEGDFDGKDKHPVPACHLLQRLGFYTKHKEILTAFGMDDPSNGTDTWLMFTQLELTRDFGLTDAEARLTLRAASYLEANKSI